MLDATCYTLVLACLFPVQVLHLLPQQPQAPGSLTITLMSSLLQAACLSGQEAKLVKVGSY